MSKVKVSPNKPNKVVVTGEKVKVVKVLQVGPQGPRGTRAIFEGGHVLEDTFVSGSFTFFGASGPRPNSFIKIDEGMSVTGSHYSASIQHTASFGRLEIAGDSNLKGNVTIGGNINIGDADTDAITISSDVSSNFIPDIDSSFNLGSSTKNWKFGYIEQVTSTHVTASGNISASGNLTITGNAPYKII